MAWAPFSQLLHGPIHGGIQLAEARGVAEVGTVGTPGDRSAVHFEGTDEVLRTQKADGHGRHGEA